MAKEDFLKTWVVTSQPGVTDVDLDAIFSITNGEGDSVNFSFPICPPEPHPGFGSGYANPPVGTYRSASNTVELTFKGQDVIFSLTGQGDNLSVVVNDPSGAPPGEVYPEAGEWGAEADPQSL